MIMVMKSIPAGEFKARCLALMDEVATTREPLVITKRGKPVAQLIPAPAEKRFRLGENLGQFEILGDIVSPIDIEWEADWPNLKPRDNA